ncbi:MAG: hypothetical protein M1828_000310 [Chrysothrix sp. TS-e1954]|nr:MAG: hypothetical protein M1828_000310 [Chrysothrix sp. TS-e1954]
MPPSTPTGTPQKAGGGGATVGSMTFSGSEIQIMVAVLTRLTQGVSLDWTEIASETGYKNGKVCQTRWSQIKSRKLRIGGASAQAAASAEAGSTGKKSGGTPSKGRKRKADEVADHIDDDDDFETHLKRDADREETLATSPSAKRGSSGHKQSKKEEDAPVKKEEEFDVDDLLAA